jgi:hypothetical protein
VAVVATTSTVWITRDRVTVQHVRGLLTALEQGGLLDYGEVRIIAMGEGSAVAVPAGFRAPGGTVLPGGMIYEARLPAEGLLFVADET